MGQNEYTVRNTVTQVLVSAAADATTQLIAAVAGKVINVMGCELHAGTADGTVVFKSAATALSGTMEVARRGEISAWNHVEYVPVLKTAASEALNVTTSGCSLSGWITYYLS